MKNSKLPAFPVNASIPMHEGLTKREYFAGLAMSGILSRSGNWNQVDDFGFVAREALIHADNLLKELEEK